MKYERFEDLPVWQTAIDLAVGVFLLAEDNAFHAKGDLRSQLQSASLSISNNIAEGFERGTKEELLSFIYIARGSAGETRSMLLFCERLPAMTHRRDELARLKAMAESCSRQLRGWADSLQNSEIKGPRHLTDKSRQRDEQKRRAEAFREKLRRSQEEGRSQKPPQPL